MKHKYIRKITPDELADFLNAKGASQDTFKCPVCGGFHQTLVDNEAVSDSDGNPIAKEYVTMQPVLPTTMFPDPYEVGKLIKQNKIPEQYRYLGDLLGALAVSQVITMAVIHVVCSNCGHVRTFHKSTIMNWLEEQGRLDEK